ncbi:MAG: MBL fold metallo-hydrolase, partial [Cyclobacteriaceae bacterium]
DRDGSRRLAGSNYDRGKALVDNFNPKEVYVYAMGQEPWCEFISSIKYTDESHPIVQSNLLVEDCKERDIVAERLFGEKELLYSKFSEPVEA